MMCIWLSLIHNDLDKDIVNFNHDSDLLSLPLNESMSIEEVCVDIGWPWCLFTIKF